MPAESTIPRRDGIAFLLAQLGPHAAGRFAARIAQLDLTPPQAGILRAIAAEPGRSQQALSDLLGLLPSRMVAFIDELEESGYVVRRRNPADRRLHALHLTPAGEDLMRRLSQLVQQHEQQITEGLTDEQRKDLEALLSLVADRQGLTAGVHPGYRSIGRAPCDPGQAPAS